MAANKKSHFQIIYRQVKSVVEMQLRKFLLVFVIFGLLGAALPREAAFAQDDIGIWSQPINLSYSGAATAPTIAVDSGGTYHVVWTDALSGQFYTQGDGLNWETPQRVSLPFAGYKPVLISDPAGIIHALWVDENTALFHSSVPEASFGSSVSWSSAFRISDSAINFNAAVDADGQLHLAYIRALDLPDQPSGIYYQRLGSPLAGWTLAQLLYASPYYRSLTSSDTNVKVSTTTASTGRAVYVAWDNRPRSRVYLIQSTDGGETWGSELVVDQPVDSSDVAGPSNITVHGQGDNILLLWQTASSDTSCFQYYQSSSDLGQSWSSRQQILDDLLGCPQRNQFFETLEGRVLLVTALQDQVYLQAWNGERWSDSLLQQPLTSFTDLDTQRQVQLGCREMALFGGTNLGVVGCDAGPGEDVWFTQRSLVDMADWFPGTPVWKPVLNLAGSERDFITPSLIADDAGRMHALWSQVEDRGGEGPGTAIFYAVEENGLWTPPTIVLASPDGKADQPAGVVDANGILHVVWSGGKSGEIYYSQVAAARGVINSAWMEPQQLPAQQVGGSSPEITVDAAGGLNVVYAIPLNEGRGIYVTRSTDSGQTWAGAVKVFDAVSAGWGMVDDPHLAISGSNRLHVVWTRFALPGNGGSMGMYYSQSQDSGTTWSGAQSVVESSVIWSQVIGVGETVVHRVWQELSGGRTTLWHELSVDNGVTWNRTAPVSIFGETVDKPSLIEDPAGRMHLLQLVDRGDENFLLQHWLWDGERWLTEQTLELDDISVNQLASLNASVSAQGILGAAFTGMRVSPETGRQQFSLYFAERPLEIPETIATPAPVGTPVVPAPTEVTSVPATEAPTAAPATDPAATPSAPVLEDPETASLSAFVWPVAAGMVILAVLLFGLRIVQGGRRR